MVSPHSRGLVCAQIRLLCCWSLCLVALQGWLADPMWAGERSMTVQVSLIVTEQLSVTVEPPHDPPAIPSPAGESPVSQTTPSTPTDATLRVDSRVTPMSPVSQELAALMSRPAHNTAGQEYRLATTPDDPFNAFADRSASYEFRPDTSGGTLVLTITAQ